MCRPAAGESAGEYLPTPQEIAAACLAMHRARDDPAGKGDVEEVLASRLERPAGDWLREALEDNERVGAGERAAGEAVEALAWPIEELGLPAVVSSKLIERGIVCPKQLSVELSEADFLGLGLAAQTARRAIQRLTALGHSFAADDDGDCGPADRPKPKQQKAAEMRAVWWRRIVTLAHTRLSQREQNRREGGETRPQRGREPSHMIGWETKGRVKEALVARCWRCRRRTWGRWSAACKRCTTRTAKQAVEHLAEGLATIALDRRAVERYAELVRAELLAG